jgi:1-acyl-sn-glycerol-3-phosphate acyltransferase
MGDSSQTPRRYRPMGGYGFTSRWAAWTLRAFGWRVEVLDPLPEKCVIIMYPHTSNWDFPVGLLAKWATGLTAGGDATRFAGKESLFHAPWGAFFRAVGGFAVNRSGGNGFVEQMTARIASEPRFRFVLSPEGTRSYAYHMRSSFYFAADLKKIDTYYRSLARSGPLGCTPENAAPWIFREK